MEMLKNWSNVMSGRGSGDDVGTLDQLKLMERFLWKTEEEGVTIIDTGSNPGMDENSGGIWCEGWADAIDVA